MSAIGKIAVRSLGPAGSLVCGFSGGSGLPGRSATRLTQCVGIASSPSRNLVGSLISGVGVERERARVHAPALARRARAVVEDVAQVAAAARAAHPGARHAL